MWPPDKAVDLEPSDEYGYQTRTSFPPGYRSSDRVLSLFFSSLLNGRYTHCGILSLFRTSVSRFLEEKTLELNEVKQKIERILDHVEKGGRKRPALDSDDSEVPVSYKKLRPEKDGALSDNIKQLKTNGFIIGQDGYVEVHTDGACEKNGTPGEDYLKDRTRLSLERLHVILFRSCEGWSWGVVECGPQEQYIQASGGATTNKQQGRNSGSH